MIRKIFFTFLTCNSKPYIVKEKINEIDVFIHAFFIVMMLKMFRLLTLMFCFIIFINDSNGSKMKSKS